MIAVVAGQDRLARRVDVDVASHHPIIDPVLPELRAMLAGLAPKSPSIPIITTVDSAGPTPAFDAEHWAANLRNPVRFSQAIATAGQQHATFIEISPHPLLAYAIKDILADTHHHSIETLQRGLDETSPSTRTSMPPTPRCPLGRRTRLNPTRPSPPPPGATPTRIRGPEHRRR